MRKPHVFISSRLKLGAARKKIKHILEEAGVSVEIYEKDSTPSSEPATYLRDVTEADFVIFIFDETYGQPRPGSTVSGLHEEWNLVRKHRLPSHVYLKRRAGQPPDFKQNRFIQNELIAREISYYYFKSTTDLLAQVRRSLVKLIFDVSRSWRYTARLDLSVLAAGTAARDHHAFSQWNRALINTLEYEEQIPGRVTDAWGEIIEGFQTFKPEKIGPFLDGKAQELFAELLSLILSLSDHDSKHTVGSGKAGPRLSFPGGPCEVTIYVPHPPLPRDFFEERHALKEKIRSKWEEIGSFIRGRYSRYAQLA